MNGRLFIELEYFEREFGMEYFRQTDLITVFVSIGSGNVLQFTGDRSIVLPNDNNNKPNIERFYKTTQNSVPADDRDERHQLPSSRLLVNIVFTP